MRVIGAVQHRYVGGSTPFSVAKAIRLSSMAVGPDDAQSSFPPHEIETGQASPLSTSAAAMLIASLKLAHSIEHGNEYLL